jgi:hypothetical protein
MPHVSSGMATEFPPGPTPTIAQLVFLPSFPFKKNFLVFNAVVSTLLEFDVFTSYDTWAWPLADVRINGMSVGQIPPRSYTQTAGELAPVSFLFNSTLLLPGGTPPGTTSTNQFEIVPQGVNVDWLLVQNWRFHYWQISPP